jgi:hypothetical protein
MGQKQGGLFLPDQRCLGGAMVLNSTYNHMLHSMGPKVMCKPDTSAVLQMLST